VLDEAVEEVVLIEEAPVERWTDTLDALDDVDALVGRS